MSNKLTESNNILDLNGIFTKRNTLRKKAESLQSAANEPVRPEDIIGTSTPTAVLISRLLNDHQSLQ